MAEEKHIDTVHSTRNNINEICSAEDEPKRLLESDSIFSNFKYVTKLRHRDAMQSKIPMCIYISFYIFACLFGNIITGIFLFKHKDMLNNIEMDLNDITTNQLEFNDTHTDYSDHNTTLEIYLADIYLNTYEDIANILSTEHHDWSINLTHINTSAIEVR